MANQVWQTNNIAASQRAMADNNVLPVVNNGAPTSGAAGTLAGFAGKGCLLIDVQNGILYINTGTQAAPTWTKVGTQT